MMAKLVVCGLLGLAAAVCLAAPHKVDPQDERGNSGHSYNVAHLGHRGPEIAQPQDSDDSDRDYPGGGTLPGGGGGYFPYSSPQRSSRVRRHEEYYGNHYYRRPYSHGQGHGPYPVPVQVLAPQSHSYSKASASASSGSGGLHG